jgi:hypothetical protein
LQLNPNHAPVETKVVAQSGTSIASGILVWCLVTFVPAFHAGIPSDLQPFVPVIAAWLVGTASGYFASHTPRLDEALRQAMQALGTVSTKLSPAIVGELRSFTPAPVTVNVHTSGGDPGVAVTQAEQPAPKSEAPTVTQSSGVKVITDPSAGTGSWSSG